MRVRTELGVNVTSSAYSNCSHLGWRCINNVLIKHLMKNLNWNCTCDNSTIKSDLLHQHFSDYMMNNNDSNAKDDQIRILMVNFLKKKNNLYNNNSTFKIYTRRTKDLKELLMNLNIRHGFATMKRFSINTLIRK